MSRKTLAFVAALGTAALIIGAGYFFFGNHGFWAEDGESFWDLWHEKGHWYLELAVGGIQMVIVDLFLGVIVWKLLLKPYISERQSRLVAEEHELHGIEDHDHELHEQVAHGFNRYDVDRMDELVDSIDLAVRLLDKDDVEAAWKVLTEVQDGK